VRVDLVGDDGDRPEALPPDDGLLQVVSAPGGDVAVPERITRVLCAADDPVHMRHVLSAGGWAEMRCDRLTNLTSSWRMHRIDTTLMTREAGSEAVLNWWRRVLTGNAPVLLLA